MTDWTRRTSYHQVPDPEDGDDNSFTLENDGRVFDQRLTRRQKLARGGLACAVVLLTTFFVLGGPDAAGALVQSLRQPRVVTAFAGHALHSPLVLLPAPGASATTPDVRINPAAGNRGDAYACWADQGSASKVGTVAEGALHAAVLTDLKAQWMPVKPPVSTGIGCTLAADTLREAWVAMAVYSFSASGNACALPDLFLSRTSGTAWIPLPWPNQWITACNVTLALTDGHLFVTAAGPLLVRNDFEIGAPERIMTTDDAGKTWQVADVGLPFGSRVDLVGLRPGGRALAVTTNSSPAATGTLWESWSNGANWKSLGRLPGADPVVEVATDPTMTSNGGWGRLYVIAQTLTNGVPDGLNSPVAETGFLGGSWTRLSLPAPITSNGDAFANEIEEAVVGPGDTLVVLRVAPSSILNTVAPANYLWVWSPASRTWQEASFIIPANTIVQGTAWGGSQMRMWMTQLIMGAPITVNVRVFTLTAAGAG